MRATRDSYALGCAGIAEGTNANTVKTSNILHYVINGRAYVKAATDNIAMAADSGSFTALAAKQVCVFFFFIDSAGTITQVQSAIYANSQAQGYVSRAIEWPHVADKCCIGAMKIDAQNSATFTAGSTDLSATDVVDTYYHPADDYGVPVTI